LSLVEMQAMNITNNVISLFQSREKSGDWNKWEAKFSKEAEFLAWAAAQYKERESEWLTEFK